MPQLATSGFQYRESGSPIVQQISRYGDTPKYADMVDRDIGDIYRHMSKVVHNIIQARWVTFQHIRTRLTYNYEREVIPDEKETEATMITCTELHN